MIKVNDVEVMVEHFPDGTQHIKVPSIVGYGKFLITWKYEKEEELSTLIYVTRHIKNLAETKQVALRMLYLPNARMDRIHRDYEVFTLKSFADVINWLDFKYVEVLDVHSDVGIALINRAYVISSWGYIQSAISEVESVSKGEYPILYFPDKGAMKRYGDMFPEYDLCYGEKVRDWNTGKITGLEIISDQDVADRAIIMIDDIISYGGSLYYSAKELKDRGAGKIYAYATHTENSVLDKEKGTLIKLLNDGTVEKLFTTDSLYSGNHKKIKIIGVYDE